MSKRFELINFLNAHDDFRDNKNNKKLDSFDVVRLLNHYDELQTLLVDKDQRIAELEEQLKNAIVLPIKIGDKCWTINCYKVYGDAKKREPYTVTRYELHENIVSGYDIYKNMMNNELKLNVVPRGKEHYKGVQPYLFATKEEAEAKLKELKGEKE